jgi:hypothetical protein
VPAGDLRHVHTRRNRLRDDRDLVRVRPFPGADLDREHLDKKRTGAPCRVGARGGTADAQATTDGLRRKPRLNFIRADEKGGLLPWFDFRPPLEQSQCPLPIR